MSVWEYLLLEMKKSSMREILQRHTAGGEAGLAYLTDFELAFNEAEASTGAVSPWKWDFRFLIEPVGDRGIENLKDGLAAIRTKLHNILRKIDRQEATLDDLRDEIKKSSKGGAWVIFTPGHVLNGLGAQGWELVGTKLDNVDPVDFAPEPGETRYRAATAPIVLVFKRAKGGSSSPKPAAAPRVAPAAKPKPAFKKPAKGGKKR